VKLAPRMPTVHFSLVMFGDGVLQTIFPSWPQTAINLLSSQDYKCGPSVPTLFINFLKTGSYYVAQAVLELLLHQPPEYWNYRCHQAWLCTQQICWPFLFIGIFLLILSFVYRWPTCRDGLHTILFPFQWNSFPFFFNIIALTKTSNKY
jgi:hypothetical protein